MTNQSLRSPIITVAGHVDHGKTSLLDNIRKTGVQESEAGGITQKISFTRVPIENIKKRCPDIVRKGITLDFPGFLFIDTPGHAAFSHLRKRGGSLADLAILLVDINEGLKPQTIEVLNILKRNKVPFIIACNKIDNLAGWRKHSESIKENIQKQSVNTKMQFDEKIFTLIGALQYHLLNTKLFYEIKDFTKEIALVPCSAKTGEGINEIILTIAGLSQKFLKEKLIIGTRAKGIILEIKKEKTFEYAEAIIYDGILSIKDEIAVASFNEPILTKIRVLEEIQPASFKFKPVDNVTAAAGIRMQLINAKEMLPGMPFTVLKDNIDEIKREFQKELNSIQTDPKGIVIKADSLGSLEALMTLLRQERIQIVSAGIGPINKKDVVVARANTQHNRINAIILGFNVDKDEEVKDTELKDIKIITNVVIYRLIDEIKKFQEGKNKQIQKERLMELATIAKIKILPQFIFRNSNPSVFGISLEAGKLKKGIPLIDENGEKIARLKDIQEDKKSVEEITEGKDAAISLPGVNFERQLQNITYLYSDMSESQFKKFKDNKDLLTSSELQALQKIAEIKRKTKLEWGV
ncbi:MAG: translation initiation factor IF-2 [Nanoarchaeota archaeon]